MRFAKVAALTGVLAVGAISIGTGVTFAANPPGNNGTIKIDAVDFDSHPDNEPHVGCVFQVDFYGFDQGNLFAAVNFEGQPPSGRGSILQDKVFMGEDSNAGGGSVAGLDASRTYDLSKVIGALKAQPQQGYHIKLTINADGSQGATSKYKVFWVRGCVPDSSGDPGQN